LVASGSTFEGPNALRHATIEFDSRSALPVGRSASTLSLNLSIALHIASDGGCLRRSWRVGDAWRSRRRGTLGRPSFTHLTVGAIRAALSLRLPQFNNHLAVLLLCFGANGFGLLADRGDLIGDFFDVRVLVARLEQLIALFGQLLDRLFQSIHFGPLCGSILFGRGLPGFCLFGLSLFGLNLLCLGRLLLLGLLRNAGDRHRHPDDQRKPQGGKSNDNLFHVQTPD
jgi:hypothetical protein